MLQIIINHKHILDKIEKHHIDGETVQKIMQEYNNKNNELKE